MDRERCTYCCRAGNNWTTQYYTRKLEIPQEARSVSSRRTRNEIFSLIHRTTKPIPSYPNTYDRRAGQAGRQAGNTLGRHATSATCSRGARRVRVGCTRDRARANGRKSEKNTESKTERDTRLRETVNFLETDIEAVTLPGEGREGNNVDH